MLDETPTSDENLPLREGPLLDDLTDYEHLLPEEFVTFVRSVEGWKGLDFETLLAEIARSASQRELTLVVRDGIERVRRIQEIKDIDIEGNNITVARFLHRIKTPQIPPHIHTEVVQNLQNIFGCERIFDAYVIGAENLKLDTEKTDATMSYIYETLIQSMIQEVERIIEESIQEEEVEDQEEVGNDDENEEEATPEDRTYEIQHIHNYPRKGIGKVGLLVAVILAGVIVERGYINFSKISHDVRAALKMILPKDTPRAIPVTSEQMQAIEARDKQ